MILNEGIELSSKENIIKAAQRGQISLVKYKGFIEEFKDKHFEALFDEIEEMPQIYKQEATILALQRCQGDPSAIFRFEADPLIAYFDNRNKKKAKEEYKELFSSFLTSKVDEDKDKKFEIKVNDLFQEQATMKSDNEVEVIYNKDGWLIVSPKTFAASKKLACMNGRKSKWCTAASSHYFNRYTNDGNKLYIIKNKEKDVMFQMDWGIGGIPNFKNEADQSATVQEVLDNVPQEVLEHLKHGKNTVYSLLVPKTEEKKVKGSWKLTSFPSLKDLTPVVGYHTYTAKKGLDTVEKKLKDAVKNKFFKISNGVTTLYFSSEPLYKDETNSTVSFPLFDDKGNRLTIDKAKKLELPPNIKKILFGTEEEPKEELLGTVDDYTIRVLKNKSALLKLLTPSAYRSVLYGGQKTRHILQLFNKKAVICFQNKNILYLINIGANIVTDPFYTINKTNIEKNGDRIRFFTFATENIRKFIKEKGLLHFPKQVEPYIELSDKRKQYMDTKHRVLVYKGKKYYYFPSEVSMHSFKDYDKLEEKKEHNVTRYRNLYDENFRVAPQSVFEALRIKEKNYNPKYFEDQPKLDISYKKESYERAKKTFNMVMNRVT